MVCFTFEQPAAQVGPQGGYLRYLHRYTGTLAHLSPLTKVLSPVPEVVSDTDE